MSQPTSAKTDFDTEEFLSVIKEYVGTIQDVPSLKGLYAYNADYIIRNSPKSSAEAVWGKRFQKATEALKIEKVAKTQPNWAEISQRISPDNSNNTDPRRVGMTTPKSPAQASSSRTKRSRSNSQTSKTDSWPMTDDAKERFAKTFLAMKDDDKWFLRENDEGKKVYLEDLMFEFGQKCEYEHTVHSFIFDPSDVWWDDDKLSDDDLKTILSAGNATLPDLDPDVQKVFKICSESISSLEAGATEDQVLRTLWQSITSFGFFDPWEAPEQEWIQRSLLDYLSMYRNRTLGEIINNGSEQDLVVRLWSNLDRCFEDLGTVGRDRTCKSTLIRLNAERKISGLNPIEDQRPSVRPDFLVMKDGLDFAVGECGKDDSGGISKKEIIERHLHVPKIMKDILLGALKKGNEKKSITRALKVAAINENSTRVQCSVLDCPKGYVCRLLNTAEYGVSENPELITAQLFPIMKLALQVKSIIKNSMNCIENHQRQEAATNPVPSFIFQNTQADTIHIPPSFTFPGSKKHKSA